MNKLHFPSIRSAVRWLREHHAARRPDLAGLGVGSVINLGTLDACGEYNGGEYGPWEYNGCDLLEISGTAAFAFTVEAALSLAVPLETTMPMAFSVTGDLVSEVIVTPFEATIPITVSVSASLSIAGDEEAHRYWRINSIDVVGYLEIAELQFLEDGTNVTGSATKTVETAPFSGAFSDLTDGNLSSRPIWTAAVAEHANFWIKMDFGVGVDQVVNGVKQAGYDTSGRHMAAFTLQWSDDDSSWTTLGSKNSLSYPGNATYSPNYIFRNTVGGHRYWQINAVDAGASYLQLRELQLLEGADNVTGGFGKTSSVAPTGALANLFDDLSATYAYWSTATAEGGGFYIRFDAGAGNAFAIDGVRQMAYASDEQLIGFTLQWSDDGSSWTTLGSKSGLSYPGANTLSSIYTFP